MTSENCTPSRVHVQENKSIFFIYTSHENLFENGFI